MRGVHGAMRQTLSSFDLPMVVCLERWLYAAWPDLLMVYFLHLTRKVGLQTATGERERPEAAIVLVSDAFLIRTATILFRLFCSTASLRVHVLLRGSCADGTRLMS